MKMPLKILHSAFFLLPFAALAQFPLPIPLVFEGDSLTAGTGAPANRNYPAQTLPQVCTSNAIFAINLGTPGLSVAQMLDREQQWQNLAAPGAIVILWGGINDLNAGTDFNTVYETIVDYCTYASSLGFHPIVTTLLPYNQNSVIETNRLDLNAFLRASWDAFADALADPAADPRIGNFNSVTNTAFYQPDHIHLTELGYGIVATNAAQAIIEASQP